MTVGLLATMLCCQGTQVSDEDVVNIGEVAVLEAVEAGGATLVDVRRAEEFAAGHLPGAVHIYLPDVRRGDDRLAGGGLIIVYGRDTSDERATAAAKRLVALDYGDVRHFRGGAAAWQGAGHDLVGSEALRRARPENDR